MKQERPTHAGSYVIEDLLGRGGMGDVYRARDPRGGLVAVKRLAAEAAEDDSLKRRFELEAQSVRQLDHPTIVKVHDIFEDETGHWIVMELAEGVTLQQLIDRVGPLPPERLLPLARRMAEGLVEAHGKGIVHRDLKTENIMVTPDEDIKVLDFGLAKHLFREGTLVTLTADGTMIGTCRSMSPEQALSEDIDHRSDLFSFGILLYEVLTGVSPFAAETPLQTVSRLVSQPHPPIGERCPELPEGLAELVEALLRKDRSQRPASAREVWNRLESISPPRGRLRSAADWLGSRLGLGARTLVLGLGMALAVGCGPGDSGPASSQAGDSAIPEPDLGASEDAVREQIGERKAHLERLLADGSSSSVDRAQAYGDLGLGYLLYDFLDAAGACFENSRRLAPEDFRWIYLGGYLHKIQGRLGPAAELLGRTLELQEDFFPAVVRLGRARLELGEFAAARLLFERALELEPNSAAALEGLGKLASTEGDALTAAGYFQQALDHEPGANSLHYALGQAHRDAGDLDQAQYHLKRRGDVAVRVPDPLLNPLADLGQGAQFYVLRGQEAMENEDYETAAAAFERALKADPEDFITYRALSYAVEKLGNREGAIQHLKMALKKASTGEAEADRQQRAEIYRILGGLVALSGNDTEATRHFADSLDLEPAQPDVRLKLANALARAQRFDEALGHYDLLLKSNPELAADLHVRRATILVNQKRADEAVQEFQRALEKDPDNAQLRLRFAEALEFLGRGDEAARQWTAASRLSGDDPDRARLLAEDGTRLVSQGRFDEAVAQFEESLRLAPDQTSVRTELASVLGHLGRLEQAVGEFRQVIEAEPRHAAARKGEIVALLLAGGHGPARVRLQEALRQFPQDAALAHLQARFLATVPDPNVRDGNLALEIASRLFAVRQDLRVRETLALAFAAAGQPERAAEMQQTVVKEAEQLGRPDLTREARGKLEVFERGQAWTFSSAEEVLAATAGGPPS